MELTGIQRRSGTDNNKKLTRAYSKMEDLIEALSQKGIPESTMESINARTESINDYTGLEKELVKLLKKAHRDVLTLIEEQLNLVARHHFRAQWLLYGMLAGALLTAVFTSTGWMSMTGSESLILPLSVFACIVVGSTLDSKARKEGRQLEMDATEY